MASAGKAGLEKALEWIEENWVGKKSCPICENTGWFMGEVMAEMRQISRAVRLMPTSGPSYPMMVLSCENCGYTLLFNAMVLGVMDG